MTCPACGKVGDIAVLLSEALDLAVRARKLDEQVAIMNMAKIGYCGPETNSGTPALWVMDQYDTDLADWEKRARKALS